MDLTATLFRHDALDFQYADGQYCVKATRPIATGTLMLLEHVLSGDSAFVLAGIASSAPLFDTLYPRVFGGGGGDGGDGGLDRQTMAAEKKDHNAFGFNGDDVVGAAFCKFNHSCRPNCYMAAADVLKYHITRLLTVDIKVYGLWAVRPIEAGEELFVDYVNGGGLEVHDGHAKHFGFTCTSCDREYIAQGAQRTDVYVQLCGDWQRRDAAFINRAVDVYSRMASTKPRLKAHFLGQRGYFECGDDVFVTKQGDPNPRRSMLKWKLKLNAK